MGGNSIGAKAPEHRYTRSYAAKLVNRSPDTLKRWHKQGVCVPSDKMTAGKLVVWLYTDDDMDVLKKAARTQKPGRKAKKDD